MTPLRAVLPPAIYPIPLAGISNDFDLLRPQDRTSKSFTKDPIDTQTREHYTSPQLLESAIWGTVAGEV
jgi:hypothetical protein